MRLYKLVSKQTDPITYSIDYLRKEWGLEDKYKKVDDFISSTIGKAKEELDRVSPYSFDYQLNSAKSADENKKRKGRPNYFRDSFPCTYNGERDHRHAAQACGSFIGPDSGVQAAAQDKVRI